MPAKSRVIETLSLSKGGICPTRLLDIKARILYNLSIMNTVLPLTEARNKFAELIDDASKMFSRFTITRNGKPEAVLMSKEEYDALIDTLEILSNPVTMASIRRGEKDIKAGRVKPLEDILKDLKLS